MSSSFEDEKCLFCYKGIIFQLVTDKHRLLIRLSIQYTLQSYSTKCIQKLTFLHFFGFTSLSFSSMVRKSSLM